MRTKHRRRFPACVGVAFLLSALVACATRSTPDPSEAVERSREFQSAAGEALEGNDLPGYLTNVAKAADLRPHHPTLLYHLARAYVMNDSVTPGLATLDRLAAMGIAVRPQGDSGFVRIWDLPAFAALRERFDSNDAPTHHSTLAFTLAGERAFLPEGVALDPRTGTFYVGSVHQQRIVRVHDGVAQPFANDVEFWSVMGMTVDTVRNLLWVATSAVAEGGHTDSADVGSAAIVALDLTTGARRGRYPGPDDGQEHWFGDLTLVPNGEVITSDSRTPAVYRLRSLDDTLVPVALPGNLQSPQGLATASDVRMLYLADYALGVVHIDLANGAMFVLPYPEDATLLGVDGLYRHGRTLIGIQNGVSPHRVVAMTLNDDGTAIERVSVLEANHPLFAEPTLGVLLADTLFYVANSEWERFSDSVSAAVASEPRILRLVLHLEP